MSPKAASSLLLALAICLTTACGRRDQPQPTTNQPLPAYSSRGVVTALPDRDGYLSIHHEAIPEFVDRQGAVGMAAMDMPFPEIAPSVDLSHIALNDKVEFTFEVDWNRATFRLTSIRPLDPDTNLDLGAADPDAHPDERTYTVRGFVAALPDPNRPLSDFLVRHEPIPDFIGPTGSVGMPAMTMRFATPSSGVPLGDLAQGDAIEFEWHVRYVEGIPRDRVTSLRRLPAPGAD